jgi:hypothetical protein
MSPPDRLVIVAGAARGAPQLGAAQREAVSWP